MRQLLLSILFLASFQATYAQKFIKDTLPTSTVVKQLSHYWRIDSLAGNGFRLYSVNELLKSKLDTVSENFLIRQLGKPNELRKTNHGTEYVYYFFDIKAMPSGYNAPLACFYIAFLFKMNEKNASEIVEGDIDR